ncbi:MAG TPA: phage tail protein [Roseiflexaceae bacterium]
MPSLGLNAAFSLATNLLGVRNDPYAAFNFLVEIEGLLVGGFSDVTGLQVEIETQPYREGGLNEYVHLLPGPARYSQNLVLKRGLTDIDTLWSWQQDVVQGKIERRNGTIYMLNRQGIPTMWWDFLQAYPVKWIGPEFRAGTSALAFESIELVHRGLSKPSLAGLLGDIAGGIAGAVAGTVSSSVSFGL